MTCIVAIKTKDKVYFGCDSMSSGHNLKHCLSKRSCKLIRHKNIVYGSTGYTAQLNWLRCSPDLSKLEYEGEDPIEFATTQVAPLVDAATTRVQISKDSRKQWWGTLLVGFGPHLFEIDCFYGSIEQGEYAACGSGEELALGSLYSTTKQKPNVRLKLALSAAAHHCTTVGGPFYFLNT